MDKLQVVYTSDMRPVVHGRWIERMYKVGGRTTISYFCSECDGEHYYGRANYCPNCGARMRETLDTDYQEAQHE